MVVGDIYLSCGISNVIISTIFVASRYCGMN